MEIPRHWRLKAQRYRLEGSTCPVCGELIFPPRPVCAECSSTMLGTQSAAGFEVLMVPRLNRLEDAISSERMIG